MSGGHYHNYYTYVDDYMPDTWQIARIRDILETVGYCIREVDYDKCGDIPEQKAKDEVYRLITELGDKYFV